MSLPQYRRIEVRGFKWPRHPTVVVIVYLLGEDEYGRWLGIARGDQWRAADYSRSGVFGNSFIKLVPHGTFWSACFNVNDPVVDVDIVLPVNWVGDTLEEVDLELDVLRLSDGTVHVRDRDEFARVCETWSMPADVVAQAEMCCEQIRAQVEQCVEPFGTIGFAWLARFLSAIETSHRPRPIE